jgi:hypothetical protein
MTQVAAGTGCRPCKAAGHFCQAHDYDEHDQPACKTCLTGDLCGPMKARSWRPDLDGPELPPALPSAPLRDMSCQHDCGRNRHRGVCAAERAKTQALEEAKDAEPVDAEPEAIAEPAPVKPAPLRGERLAERIQKRAPRVASTCPFCSKPTHRGRCSERRAAEMAKGRVDEPTPAAHAAPPDILTIESRPSVRELMLDSVLRDPANVSAVRRALGLPSFEVIPRTAVPWRKSGPKPYTELCARLKELTPGDSLKMRFPSAAEARRFAKNLTRPLKNHTPPVSYERHGEAIFFAVRYPDPTPNSEVRAL